MKGFFSDKSPLFQLGMLIYFSFMGLLFSVLIQFIIGKIVGEDVSQGGDSFFYITQSSQIFSSALIFLLPALSIAYLCSKEPFAFLYIKKSIDAKSLLLSAAMVILIYPTVDITSYFNANIHLPEFMAPIESLLRETEEHLGKIVDELLSTKGIIPFIINILVIGVMAGIAEEFLFRGAILSIIRKMIKNPHIAIWVVAFIFSAIHFQFLGFIPRMILGAFMGYLLYWTNNIWVPVFAHFLNNTLSVIGYKMGLYQSASDSNVLIPENPTITEIIIAVATAIVGLALFALCAKKLKVKS